MSGRGRGEDGRDEGRATIVEKGDRGGIGQSLGQSGVSGVRHRAGPRRARLTVDIDLEEVPVSLYTTADTKMDGWEGEKERRDGWRVSVFI